MSAIWEEQRDQSCISLLFKSLGQPEDGPVEDSDADLCMDLKAFARQVSCGRRVGKGGLLTVCISSFASRYVRGRPVDAVFPNRGGAPPAAAVPDAYFYYKIILSRK